MLEETTQDTKLVRATSDLGDGVLLPTSVRTDEALGRPFRIELDAISARDDIAPAELIGTAVAVEVHVSDERVRTLHGRVARLGAGPTVGHGFRRYRLELVPWTWFLDRRVRCRVFQEQSIPEILEAVLDDHPFADFSLDGVSGEHPPLEYCVQYREGDFQFAQRLMERAGIFYRFEFTADGHKLALADGRAAYVPAEPATVDLIEGSRPDDHLWTWERDASFISGAIAQEDYEFKTPSLDLEVGTQTVLDLPHATDHEVYEYPAGFRERADGERLAALRMEELETGHERVRAEGALPLLELGSTFTIGQHDAASEEGREWLVVALSQEAFDSTHRAGGAPRRFATKLEAIPAERTFRPERSTPTPQIRGPQTAVVTGPSGEEIYTDEFGRIKVHFHWDREGPADENSSCFLRIAQAAAGSGWGSVFTPRVGDEVVVGFIDADPDRPLVMSGIYNAEMLPPFGDSASNRNSGFRSRSTGGDASKGSEMRFDDTGGSEGISLKAEKDMTQVVQNDLSVDVQNNLTSSVAVDEVGTVGGTRTHTITGDDTLTAEANRTVTVGADETVEIGGSRTTDVAGTDTTTITGAMTLTVTGAQAIGVSGAVERTTDSSCSESVSSSYELVAGSTVKLEGASIELVAGGSSIKIEPGGITIKSGSGDVKVDAAGVTMMGAKIALN